MSNPQGTEAGMGAVSGVTDTRGFHYMRDGTKGVVFFAHETRIGSWRRRSGLSWASLQLRAAIRVQRLNEESHRIGFDETVAEAKAGRL